MRANIENGIIERLQERYPQAEITLRDVQKTNVTLRAVSIKEKGATLAPTLYLDEIYETVKDVNVAAEIIARNYEKTRTDITIQARCLTSRTAGESLQGG